MPEEDGKWIYVYHTFLKYAACMLKFKYYLNLALHIVLCVCGSLCDDED